MKVIFLFCMLLFFSFAAKAQQVSTLYSETPLCALVTNKSSQTIFVGIRTAFYELEGEKKRHQANLRLAPEKSQQFCAKGPFYEGYKVELTIRTLMPVFNCLTSLGQNIDITSETDEEEITRFQATCH